MIPAIALAFRSCVMTLPSIFRHIVAVLLCGYSLAFAGEVRGEELQSLESIRQAVLGYLEEQHVGADIAPRINIGHLDPRLRLASCGAALEVFTPPGQRVVGTSTLGVRCAAPAPWTVYVQATVAMVRPVLISRRPLLRGTVLGSSDVDRVEKDVTRLTSGYLVEIEEINGMVLRRSVNAGAVLHPGLVQHPVSIRRGERVTILGQSGGIDVRMEGQALMDGAKGEVIRVRNLSSGRDVEGVVVAPGVIQVRL